MAKSYEEQASALLKKYLALGKPKKETSFIEGTTYKQFRSVRSFNETSQTLARVARELQVKRIKEITPEMAQRYLYNRNDTNRKKSNVLHAELQSERVGQKTLDAERKALSIMLNSDIARVYSKTPSLNSSRAYTDIQVNEIIKHQSEKNALSTLIADNAGLRSIELITLRRADELHITNSPKWHKDRFKGVSGERYVTTGKGGLVREIRISTELSARLEKFRREQPVEVMDRKAKYTSYYDIGGGNNFSKSYSEASTRALGFSNGAHGLRHKYAQRRMETLIAMGFDRKTAKRITSQEVGHFRASIINVYLR